MRRILKSLFILLIAVAFLTFAIVNRQTVSINLFPLPYSAELPEFLLAIICFAAGSIIGWLIGSLKFFQARREAKAEHQRVVALENEVKALHSEHEHHTPPPALEEPT